MLPHLQSLDNEQLALELDEILLGCDGIWTTEEGMVASTAALLDGVCFSHRITTSELERGVLDAIPDLIVLDFDIAGSLTLESGGGIQVLVRGRARIQRTWLLRWTAGLAGRDLRKRDGRCVPIWIRRVNSRRRNVRAR